MYYCTPNFSTVSSCFFLSFAFFSSSFLMSIPSASILSFSLHAYFFSLSLSRTFIHALFLSPGFTFTLAFFFLFFWCLLYSKRHFLVRFFFLGISTPASTTRSHSRYRSANERRAFLHILAAPLFAPCLDNHSRPKYLHLFFFSSLSFLFLVALPSSYAAHLSSVERLQVSVRTSESSSSKNAPAL